jgi:putative ABC transport system permease protein
MTTLLQDLLFAVRRLLKSPGFALAAVLTLALGIGANTAIFQLVEAVQLRSLPVRDPAGLVEIQIADMTAARGPRSTWRAGATNAIWEEIRGRQEGLSGVFAWSPRWLSLESSGDPRFASAIFASGGFFETLGVRPGLGRLLTDEDDRKGCGSPVVVLSHAFWQREYAGDASVVGRTIKLGRYPYQVVGVSAAGFTGLEVGQSFDVAVPICAEALPPGSESRLDSGTEWWLVVMGRLKPGWTRERASAQLAAISPAVFESSLPSNYPRESVDSYLAFKLQALPASGGVSLLREQYSGSLFFLQATAGLVLLVGCANIASLMLARATARERELAARVALGAGRGRLVQLLLCESLVLAGLGALGGAWLAGVLSSALVSAIDTQPSTLFLDLALDWRVFGFAAFVATTTCALFGLAPALRAARVSPESVMRLATRGTTEGRGRLGLRRALVVAQVGLSLVLVAGAFLSARSLGNLLRQDTGLELDNILIAYVDLTQLELTTDRRLSYRTELVERLRGVPGVVSVAETTVAPLTGSRWSHEVWREGGDSAQRTRARMARTSRDYFATMGVRVVEGRVFDARDTAQVPNVAIVNQALARAVFGSASPVGQRFRRQATPRDPEQVFEVVGVVQDTKYRELREAMPPIAYMAASQDPQPMSFTQLLIRTTGAPKAMVPTVREGFRQANPAIVATFVDYPGLLDRALVRDRLVAMLSGFFGLLALMLATLGLYGVMAFVVARRTAEIGIRMALGAQRTAILRMVLRESLVLIALGVAAGSALTLALAHTVRSLVFGIEPNDPLTLAAAGLVLGLVGLLASFFPANRAARLDPVAALHQE